MANEYYHTEEAATAHLAGVGLTFEGFAMWTIDNARKVHVERTNGAFVTHYPASLLREYIRENNNL